MQSQHSNEPTRFGIRTGQIETFLARKGFKVIDHITAAEMNSKFLSKAGYSDVGYVPGLFCLVEAEHF
jgi:O-methyltransferase involved in polyketide biosynthesis